jgi:DNA modification methylase
MNRPSWIHLKPDSKEFEVSSEIKTNDPFAAVDIGYVGQMRFLLKEYALHTGARVLDPFAGLGTTLLACHLEGHQGYGTEIEPSRVEAATKRLKAHGINKPNLVQANAQHLPFENNFFDLILSSLPYFGADRDVAQGWSAEAGHLYHRQSYDSYLATLQKITGEIRRVLKPKGLVILVAENIRLHNGQWVPLAWDAGRVLSEYFAMHEERIIIYDRERGNATDRFTTNRAHEYVLIGEKI